MSRVRFHAGDIDLELHGSEPFVLRQLKLLSSLLGRVDQGALEATDAALPPPVVEDAAPAPVPEAPSLPEPAAVEALPAPANGSAAPANGGTESHDELLSFFRGFHPVDLDRQSDAALLFAYWLQQREGFAPLLIGDLIRCCIRAGVDTRNFNRTLGTLTRRGFLESAAHGQGYRLSDQGVAAVENRM
jgi:hypothetical protein